MNSEFQVIEDESFAWRAAEESRKGIEEKRFELYVKLYELHKLLVQRKG